MKTLLVALAVFAVGVSTAEAKDTHRKVIDKYFEIVDGKELDRLGEIEVADVDMLTPMGPVKGIEGHKQLIESFHTAFPGLKHTTSRCVEAGDLISCEGVFSGDHKGPMMMPDGKSVPATGKHVEFPYLGMARIKGGKVAQLHVYFNPMIMMMQMGLMPPPAAPPSAAAR